MVHGVCDVGCDARSVSGPVNGSQWADTAPAVRHGIAESLGAQIGKTKFKDWNPGSATY